MGMRDGPREEEKRRENEERRERDAEKEQQQQQKERSTSERMTSTIISARDHTKSTHVDINSR
jgi:hypothetical protein